MPRLRMIDVGLPYKKIMQGGKWVGRVYKNAQGTYTGQMGKSSATRIEATAPTEQQAFAEVAARFFGQPSAAALHAHNAEVRSANRSRRAMARSIAEDMMRGDPTRMNQILDRLLTGFGPHRRPDASALERAERETQRAMFEAESGGEDDFMYRTNRRRRH